VNLLKQNITDPRGRNITQFGNSVIKKATESYVAKRNQIHDNLRDYIIQWSKTNQEVILATPLNRIKPTLKPLMDSIQERFGIKAFRVISKAVFGMDRGRKELLRFMQSVCNEKIC
jgi:hypothetical protein